MSENVTPERDIKALKQKVATARKHGSHAGLSIFDAEWALDRLEQFETTSIRTPLVGADQAKDDLAAISVERDRERARLKIAIAALKKIHHKRVAPGLVLGKIAQAALRELGES